MILLFLLKILTDLKYHKILEITKFSNELQFLKFEFNLYKKGASGNQFWPIRIQDFDFGQTESRIPILTNQNPGFRFWPIRIQDFDFGQSESRISILTNQNPGFRFWPIRILDFNFGQSVFICTETEIYKPKNNLFFFVNGKHRYFHYWRI